MCAERFTINQNLILTKSRQKISNGLLQICFYVILFYWKENHMSLGENSNFSLMLLVWGKKWILRPHVPKFGKCHVDLKYMACIYKCCHMDVASHLNTTKTEQLMPPKTSVWRENVIWHKVSKSEITEDLKEFCFPYLLGFNNLDSLKHCNNWWTH